MRQAIRVYATVALLVLGAFLAVWWASPTSITRRYSWFAVLNLLAGTPLQLGVQLWVLLVIPLGVLAASDAAHAGRRGWLAAFIALIVLAAIAPYFEVLAATAQNVLAPRCAPAPCYPDLGEQSRLMIVAPWIGGISARPSRLTNLHLHVCPGHASRPTEHG